MRSIVNSLFLLAALLLASCDEFDDLFDRVDVHPDAVPATAADLTGTWELTAFCAADSDTLLLSAFTIEIGADSTVSIFVQGNLLVQGDWSLLAGSKVLDLDFPGDDDGWDDFDARWSIMYNESGQIWLLHYDGSRHGHDDDDEDDDEDDDDEDEDEDEDEDDDEDDDDHDGPPLNCELKLQKI